VSEASDQTSGRDEATPPTRTNTSARWVHRALYLVAATALYNAIEAVVAIVSGILAASIALVAFGLDSVIELAAAGVCGSSFSLTATGAPKPENAAF
jgi:hypothetical protein